MSRLPPPHHSRRRPRAALAAGIVCGVACVTIACPVPARAQQTEQREAYARSDAQAAADAAGLPIVDISIVGNRRTSDAAVLNAIRSEVGQPLDLATVSDDYQRVYALRRFRRVDARYEAVPLGNNRRGVRLVFEVEETLPVRAIRFRGNRAINDADLREIVEQQAGFVAGESGDPLLLSFAVSAMERAYKQRNHALVRINAQRDEETGAVVFDIVEGPVVRVRNIDFLGADSFSERQLKGQIGTRVWWPLNFFGYNGRFDEAQLEQDVASVRRFYQQEQGYFDARVGRRVVWSADLSEVQIEFLIDEGPRYEIGTLAIEGNEKLSEAEIRRILREAKVAPGQPYDRERLQAANRELVKAYSPFGLIYPENTPPGVQPDPDYLTIDVQPGFRLEPGVVDLTLVVDEGRAFTVGNIEVRGNDKTQDKVILRQFDLAPGQPYDSDAVSRATRRLQSSGYFNSVRVTPVRTDLNDDDERNLLIEVDERSTAILTFGGSVSSNGGVFGQIKYEQTNFDAFDFPGEFDDLFGEAFTGGGQTLRISLEPGTTRTNASVSFFEPYFFDQPLGFGADAYYRTFRREQYRDTRGGGGVRFVPKFGRNLSIGIGLNGEDVRIYDLDEPDTDRAPEILAGRGHTTLTSVSANVGYTRVDSFINTSSGFKVDAAWETFGVLGGPSFQKITAGANAFVPLYRDMRDRPTVFELRADAGAIYNNAPFFERFYGGGFGSVRGFRFRGISPRSGPDDDAIGGDFSLTGSAAIGFPLYDETLRGVIFSDFGSVDDDPKLTTMRVSAGFGFRLTFQALGPVPIAFDFAWPLNSRDEDDEQVFSFSLGILQ